MNAEAWYQMAMPSDIKEEDKKDYKIPPNSVKGDRSCSLCGVKYDTKEQINCVHFQPNHYTKSCTYLRFGFMCTYLEDK
jgi:hypothetical protein